MNGRSWTTFEIATLRRHVGKRPYRWIAARLRRTVPSVRTYALRSLGLSVRRHWSKRELAFLRCEYHRLPTREIARRLGRTKVVMLPPPPDREPQRGKRSKVIDHKPASRLLAHRNGSEDGE